jgi:hypothetical protein
MSSLRVGESNFCPAPGNFPQRTAANTRFIAGLSLFFRCNNFGSNRNAIETMATLLPALSGNGNPAVVFPTGEFTGKPR